LDAAECGVDSGMCSFIEYRLNLIIIPQAVCKP
jgi:hypothetical protein